jgi:hypothetical protein
MVMRWDAVGFVFGLISEREKVRGAFSEQLFLNKSF